MKNPLAVSGKFYCLKSCLGWGRLPFNRADHEDSSITYKGNKMSYEPSVHTFMLMPILGINYTNKCYRVVKPGAEHAYQISHRETAINLYLDLINDIILHGMGQEIAVKNTITKWEFYFRRYKNSFCAGIWDLESDISVAQVINEDMQRIINSFFYFLEEDFSYHLPYIK
jgi:hypothetical protein